VAQLVRHCPDCCQDRPFEQLHDRACPDGAGGECPEWMCAVCGAALLISVAIPVVASTALGRPAAGREVTRRARVA
jgi:hypothetical protein